MRTDAYGRAWICTGCKKIVSHRPLGQCADCGGEFREATDEDAACDRCGDPDGRRLLDRRGEWDRLCQPCVDEVIESGECDWCGEEHGALQASNGEFACPPCIHREAARQQAEKEERRRRTEVTRERGRWRQQ